MPARRTGGLGLLAALILAAGAPGAGCADPEAEGPSVADVERRVAERDARALGSAVDRIEEAADGVDELLHPLPLLRPAEEAALRRHLAGAHLRRARELGAPPGREADVDRLVEEGRLVELPDTTERWVVRELDHSLPVTTPDAKALLDEIGRRFHARLDSLGLPRWRIEVSSVLRTAEQQAELRSENVNAARGTSAHEFGTTFDVVYAAFAAPAEPITDPSVPEAPDLRPTVRRIADLAAEKVAARRSRELQAVLGRVLREMQEEGLVYVTLERLQPVYHLTVARPLAGGAQPTP